MRKFLNRFVLLGVSQCCFLLAGQTLNVQSYGATGNGSTDDTLAINRAIQAIPASGGTLYFPCGIYVVTSGLRPIAISNVLVTGPTSGCATLKPAGSGSFTALQVLGSGLTRSAHLAGNTTGNTFTTVSGGLAQLGIGVGSYVLISDEPVASNGSGSPLISTQQVVKVTAINGDTATIEGTFAHQFTLSSPYPENQGGDPYVQKISSPVTNVRIEYLNFDGSGSRASVSNALQMNFAVNSEIGFVNVSNFLQVPGPSTAILVDTGYKNSYHDIQCSACGNGTSSDGHSFQLNRQSWISINNVSIKNLSSQYSFAADLGNVDFSVISNLSADQGGADGRPFKLLRSNYNTINSVTAKNGGTGKNGIDVTDMSTYNTFNNCVAIGNQGSGIKMFGNYNVHNTFNDCQLQSNSDGQFGQGQDAFGHLADHYTTITGGAFSGGESSGFSVVYIESDFLKMTGAAVTGPASNGLVVSGNSATVENNSFSGFRSQGDIYVENGLNTSTYMDNRVPDGTNPESTEGTQH